MGTKLLYFFGGVLSGCLGTYLVMNRRMEERINEEVESVKELYSEKREKASKIDSESISNNEEYTDTSSDKDAQKPLRTPQEAKDIVEKNNQRKADLAQFRSLSEENGYVNTHKTEYNLFSNPPKASQIENGIDDGEDLDIINTTPEKDAKGPYVLESDDVSSASEKFVNEEPYFDKVTLFLYDDGVLCSEEDEIITNIAATVGEESLRRIGEYEPDVVYVRNERDSTDYEVIRQYRDFMNIPNEDI